MKKFAALAALALLASVGASAQDESGSVDENRLGAGLYGELGFTKIKASNSAAFAGASAKPTMLRGVLGKELTPNLAAEFMLGLGAGTGSLDYKYTAGAPPVAVSTRVESEIKNMLGFYIVPKVALNDRAQAYARLGFTNITANDTPSSVMAGLPAGASDNMTNGKRNSVSWGLGASYRIGENVGVSLDYMVYHKKSQVKVDGVNLGLTYKF